jgi:uncharacterized protein (TIGR02246 family)
MGNTAATGDEAAIRALLSSYQDALNASSTSAVMPLYAQDGVFMPQHSPSSVGIEAVRVAYDAVFKAIKLTVRFDVVEVVQMAPDWAFARTNSSGTTKIHATDATNPEANQELFLFRKDGRGAWKIARYCFSTTTPPR